MEPALRITAFGEVDQRRLDQLRRDLDLRSTGRLTDHMDSMMGLRFDDLGEGSKVSRSLSRDADRSWTFSVSSEGSPPATELLDQYRTEALAAFERAGLVVNREWRR
jgi:hypothetical protein